LKLERETRGRRLQLARQRIGKGGTGRIYEERDFCCRRDDLAQQLELFRAEFHVQDARAGEIAPGPTEAGDEPYLNWINADTEDNRHGRCRRLGRQRSRRAGGDYDTHPTAHKVGRARRQAIILAIPAVLDRDIAAIVKARLAQALTESLQPAPEGSRQAEKSDHRQCALLLCLRDESW
jgi:hypothetical protein